MQTDTPQQAIRRLQKLACHPTGSGPACLQPDRCALHDRWRKSEPTSLPRAQPCSARPQRRRAVVHWFDSHLARGRWRAAAPGLTAADLLGLDRRGPAQSRAGAPGHKQDLTLSARPYRAGQHQPDAALADFTRALDLQVHPAWHWRPPPLWARTAIPRKGLRMLDHYQQVAKPRGATRHLACRCCTTGCWRAKTTGRTNWPICAINSASTRKPTAPILRHPDPCPRAQCALMRLSLHRLWLLAVAFIVTAAVYWPGLSGGFLFDDYPNIVDNHGVQPHDASFRRWWAPHCPRRPANSSGRWPR